MEWIYTQTMVRDQGSPELALEKKERRLIHNLSWTLRGLIDTCRYSGVNHNIYFELRLKFKILFAVSNYHICSNIGVTLI